MNKKFIWLKRHRLLKTIIDHLFWSFIFLGQINKYWNLKMNQSFAVHCQKEGGWEIQKMQSWVGSEPRNSRRMCYLWATPNSTSTSKVKGKLSPTQRIISMHVFTESFYWVFLFQSTHRKLLLFLFELVAWFVFFHLVTTWKIY